jgi:peptide/nickel transport system substrate-binding protein
MQKNLLTLITLMFIFWLAACQPTPAATEKPADTPAAAATEAPAEKPTDTPVPAAPTAEATVEPTQAAAATQEKAGGEKVLRFPYLADINTFDPDNGFEVAGLGAILAVYQNLVEYKPDTTELQGLLAEKWDISKDGLTYTFHLRKGVTFHDGKPMTSAEVKAAFDRRRDEKSAFALSYFFWNVSKMDTPDPETLVVTLGMPQPSFLDNMASAWGPKVVGPGALKDNAGEDLAATYLNEAADGTGPYILKEFKRGEGYVLERFEQYWGEKPYFDRIEIKIVPDIGQQILQLQNGDIDMLLHGYPFAQLAQLPAGLKTEAYNDLGLEMAYVKTTAGPLKDPAVREAIKAAINPATWLKDAFGDFAEPAQSLYPKAMLTPQKPLEWPTDLEAAKAAIAKAGQVDIVVGYAAEEAGVQQRVADLLVAQLQTIGVNATARANPQEESYTFAQNLDNAPDLYLVQNNPDAAHPETFATLFYTTGAALNIMGYSNPKADELVTQAGALTDRAERDKLYEEASALYFADGGFFPLADVKDVIVYREGLTNLVTRPAIPWNVDLGMIKGE